MPSFVESIFNLIKSFAKDKMKERFHVHQAGELEAIQEDIGKDVLPEEYGGNNGTIQDHLGNVIDNHTCQTGRCFLM